jgi:hypothetical protein
MPRSGWGSPHAERPFNDAPTHETVLFNLETFSAGRDHLQTLVQTRDRVPRDFMRKALLILLAAMGFYLVPGQA